MEPATAFAFGAYTTSLDLADFGFAEAELDRRAHAGRGQCRTHAQGHTGANGLGAGGFLPCYRSFFVKPKTARSCTSGFEEEDPLATFASAFDFAFVFEPCFGIEGTLFSLSLLLW